MALYKALPTPQRQKRFAGLWFPRRLAVLPEGTIRERLKRRKSPPITGGYIHWQQPAGRGLSFYLHTDNGGCPFALRWTWANRDHDGWFIDEEQDETVTGVAFRLPKGRGFLAGYSLGVGMMSFVDTGSVYADLEETEAVADSMAENYAEGCLIEDCHP